jgi:hypothetical protein
MKILKYSLAFFLVSGSLIAGNIANSNPDLKPSASYTNESQNVSAICDGIEPASSSDYRIPRHTFYPHTGSNEWLEYEFKSALKIKNIGVYWFDEAQAGPVSLPKSWKLMYFKNNEWLEASILEDYGVERDQFNIVELTKAVSTKKIRVEVQLHDELSAGVLEMKVNLTNKKEEVTFSDPDKELTRLKNKASDVMALDVDEFNGYSHLNGKRAEFDGWLKKHNNNAFLQQNVPKFLCSNEDFTEVFNYRWWMISKHLKEWEEDGKTFYVFTEFPGSPGWSSNSGAIPAPAGHQFYDLRWMRDPKYLKSYAEYWFVGSPSIDMQLQNNTWLSTLPRPQSHHYTSWMVDATEAMLKVHPDPQWRDKLLPAMERHQEIWDKIFQVKAPGMYTDGLYKCLDMYDANEFTISTTLALIASKGAFAKYNTVINEEEPYKGQEQWRRYFTDGKGWRAAFEEDIRNKPNVYPQAYDLKNYTIIPQPFGGNHNNKSYPNCFTVRPSLNSYMYGNYKALSVLYEQQAAESKNDEDHEKSLKYAQRAEELGKDILDALWHNPTEDDKYQFYEKQGAIDDPFFYTRLSGDNLYTGGVVDQLSIIRESVGYTPWYFNMMPTEASKYDIAWKQFEDPNGFKLPYGMSTAEYRHDYFNEMSYGWNGRGWPFQNSVVYKAYANYLKNYKSSRSSITDNERQLLYHHMNQYVELHGRRRSIGEFYLPINGGYSMPGGGAVVKSKPEQGKGFGAVQDYFHSTFPDMLIEDLLGFGASHSHEFTLEPLLPEDKWDYFYLGDLRYHDKEIDIIWKKDWDTDMAGNQSKLRVWVDGKLVAESESLNDKLTVALPLN